MIIRICFLLTLLLTLPLMGQSGGTLEVTSDPAGTVVNLEGEFKLAGVTPTVFSQPLHGSYKLIAKREGYETYRTRITLTGGAPVSVNIQLAPKTRFKAFIRSMVIPGWGQFYAGEKTRGTLFGLATIGSGIVTLVSQLDYQDKREAYDDFLAEFVEERSIERKMQMESMLDQIRKEAYDAETKRNITLGVLAAVWVYNLFDAVIFFPDKKYESRVPQLTFETNKDMSRTGLALNFRF